MRAVDYALHCTRPHGKGSVDWREGNRCAESMMPVPAFPFMRQANDLLDEWDAKQKFTWEA